MTRSIKIGDKVRRTYGSETSQSNSEVGIVVHIWRDEVTDLDDAYVAFFGSSFPRGRPATKPIVLRYFVDGLELIES